MHKILINILLVDDDPGDRRLVELALEKSRQPVKFALETAGSLTECLEHLKNNKFDLLLLDLGLPDSQGLETVDKVSKACPQTPIVVLTGLADEEAGVEAIKRGASDYLVKSKFFRDILVRTIRYSLERKKAGDALKSLNKELEATVEKLTKTNRELEDFAYVVSHDLKAPLRGIKTLTEWISGDYADKIDENGVEQLNLLSNRADRMHNLIEGILQYSRVGRVKEEQARINLNELVPQVIDLIARPENISITVENELPTITFEPTRVTQVFQNLLSNAVKYMDKPQGQVRVACVEDNGFWKFSVADNGPGIDQRHFERIFRMFQTLLPKDEFESTGIGLTVTKKIVEMYGGKIWVESEPGQGSTFLFTFPKQEPEVVNAEFQTNNAC